MANGSMNAPRALASRGPAIIVSVVLFRLHGHQLQVCLQASPDRSLPCAPPGPDESLDAAAHRLVRSLLHMREAYMEQLYTFSPENADHRNVVISYLALIPPLPDQPESPVAHWATVPVTPLLGGTDDAVLTYALVRLRAKLGYSNIAFHLMPERFTLPELQRAYETILAQPMDKRNFRRRIIATGILTQTGDKRRDGSHRPAALYRFTSQDDQTTYLTPMTDSIQETPA
jgi:8-oxo-dGTP diphosphatase